MANLVHFGHIFFDSWPFLSILNYDNRSVPFLSSPHKSQLVKFSVYTTIGYGTISASSMSARIATVFYGMLGIPLFFAFIKEEGNMFRTSLLMMLALFNMHNTNMFSVHLAVQSDQSALAAPHGHGQTAHTAEK